MALIKCPECGKEFSDLAKSCPNCAWPVPESQPSQQEFPSLPSVLAIGEPMKLYNCNINDSSYAPSSMSIGAVVLHLHEFGLCFFQNFKSFYIHNSQILNINVETSETVKNKSVIGRAAVGTLLLGPFGGIIGGISGLGNKTKTTFILFLDYFDVYSHNIKTVIISSKEDLNPLASEFKYKSKKTIGNSHFICNLKNDKGELDDIRILECLQKLGKQIVLKELEKKYLRTKNKAEEIVNNICIKNDIDTSALPEKKDHGCAAILILPVILSLFLLL